MKFDPSTVQVSESVRRLNPDLYAPAPKAAPVGDDSESALHNQILAYCRSQRWVVFHGSMAHRAMRTLGEPDFVIWTPGRVLLVECKTRVGKLSQEQSALHQQLQSLGHTVYVVRSLDEFLSVVPSQMSQLAKSGKEHAVTDQKE